MIKPAFYGLLLICLTIFGTLASSVASADLNVIPELKDTNGCLLPAEANQVLSDFHINIGEKFDRCAVNSNMYKVVEALLFIKNLHFDGKKPVYPFNQEILGYDWYGRLNWLSPNFSWGDGFCQSKGSSGGVAAYVRPIKGKPDTLKRMYLCRSAFHLPKSKAPSIMDSFASIGTPEEHSFLQLVVTMMHESRHLEGPFHHTSCTNGLIGPQMCDLNIADRGAFAAEVEALAKIGSTASNVPPRLAYIALLRANVVAQDRFRITPVKSEDPENVTLLQARNGERFAFDGRYLRRILQHKDAGPLFPVADGHFMLVPLDRTKKATLIGTADFLWTGGDDRDMTPLPGAILSLDLYNQSSPKSRENFVGAANLSAGIHSAEVSVWKDAIHVLDRRSRFEDPIRIDLPLPAGGVPERVFPIEDTPLQGFASAVGIVDSLGKVYRLDMSEKGDVRLSAANPGLTPETHIELEQHVYSIEKSGKIVEETKSGSQPVAKLNTLLFDSMSLPFRDVPEIPFGLDPNVVRDGENP